MTTSGTSMTRSKDTMRTSCYEVSRARKLINKVAGVGVNTQAHK